MANSESASRENLTQRIDEAVNEISDGNYSDAHDILTQKVDASEPPNLEGKFRDPDTLMNYLETDIALELSQAAYGDTVYNINIEEIRAELQQFADDYF